MFDELSSRLTDTLRRLTGRGVLTEAAVREGLRDIRRVLLEADVSFDLTREFLERVQAKAVGEEVLKAVRPGQQLVKVVYDELVVLLGEKQAPLAFASVPPTVILIVGLQGSRQDDDRGQAGAAAQGGAEGAVPDRGGRISPGRGRAAADARPAGGCRRAWRAGRDGCGRHRAAGIEAASKARARSVLVDTAGRLQIDDEMMQELVRLKAAPSGRTRSSWSPTA